jgi:peptide/nickel transport system substrate-binding protein
MQTDRRAAALMIGASAALALAPWPRQSSAAAPVPLASEPWAVSHHKERPVRGGILRVAAPLYIGSMNPNRWPVHDWFTMGLIHDRLFLNDGSYLPSAHWLAESMVQETATAVLLTLRPGVRFHDGSPMTAVGVKRQIDWIRDPDSGTWSAFMLRPLESVEAIGPLQLRFTFKEPWASFAGVMASVPGFVLPEAALGSDNDRFNAHPIGSGPYIVEEANPGNFLKLKRNPDWWLAKAVGRPDMPYFDGVHIAVIPDPGVRLANFRAGKLDVMQLAKSQYPLMMGDRRANVYVEPLPITTMLRFNSARGACADIRVRKAIGHAIDRKALLASTQHGLGRIASGLFPGDHWAHDPALAPMRYDPALARELLAQAGHGNGLTITGYMHNSPPSQTLAGAIRAMLRNVGVTWQVDLLAPTAMSARYEQGGFDLAYNPSSWIYDPDIQATGGYQPGGIGARFRTLDPDLVAMIDAARTEMRFAQRQALYHAIEGKIVEDHLNVYLWWEESATAMQKYVRGFDPAMEIAHGEAWTYSHSLWFEHGRPGKPG